MSTATKFKHYRPFPFCVEELSDTDIAALGFLAYDCGPDIADAMGIFWNLENVRMGVGSPLVYDDVPMADPTATSIFTPVVPRSRVCFQPDYDAVLTGTSAGTELMAQTDVLIAYEVTVRLCVRGIKKSTDTGNYHLILTVDITADDGALPIATTDSNNPDLTTLSTYATVNVDLGVGSSVSGYQMYQAGAFYPAITADVSQQEFYTY